MSTESALSINPELDPTYEAQLEAKHERLSVLLSEFYTASIELYRSRPTHYRNRAEFGVWHEGDQWHYTMMLPDDQGVKQRTYLKQLSVADESINQAMSRLAVLIDSDLLKRKLFQVEFLSTLSGELLITLIYHKPLDDEWIEAARPLQIALGAAVIGRSRKQKVALSRDYVTECFSVQRRKFSYRQPEGAFSQPNARMCEQMLGWAADQADQIEGLENRDLLELYCGNGNFTLPLALKCRRALATEISKTSTAAAIHNAAANCVDNLNLIRLSAEEVGEALAGSREFRRLKQAEVNLSDYDFGLVFVDPPRAGIDGDTLALLAQFDHLIYVSCNPETLARDLGKLCDTHEVISAALFDQFPGTPHIESGVRLVRRS